MAPPLGHLLKAIELASFNHQLSKEGRCLTRSYAETKARGPSQIAFISLGAGAEDLSQKELNHKEYQLALGLITQS